MVSLHILLFNGSCQIPFSGFLFQEFFLTLLVVCSLLHFCLMLSIPNMPYKNVCLLSCFSQRWCKPGIVSCRGLVWIFCFLAEPEGLVDRNLSNKLKRISDTPVTPLSPVTHKLSPLDRELSILVSGSALLLASQVMGHGMAASLA